MMGFLVLFGFKSLLRFFEDGVTITKYEFVPEKITSPGIKSIYEIYINVKPWPLRSPKTLKLKSCGQSIVGGT